MAGDKKAMKESPRKHQECINKETNQKVAGNKNRTQANDSRKKTGPGNR